jgi:hypothetical protein
MSFHEKNAMRFIGNDLWTLTIWPPDFFGLDSADELLSMTYNFTNESQNIVVNDPFSGNDFSLNANCNE